jgi:hypothetical protein
VAEDDTTWEGSAPPVKVLGPIMEKMPSALLGPVSLLFLTAGLYCAHESNIFHTLTEDTIQPVYILGSLLTPISWGLHVAAYIQKKNGN